MKIQFIITYDDGTEYHSDKHRLVSTGFVTTENEPDGDAIFIEDCLVGVRGKKFSLPSRPRKNPVLLTQYAWNENQFRRVDEPGLWGNDHIAKRIQKALPQQQDITYIIELLFHDERSVLKFRNISRASLQRIKDVLAEMNLCLNMPQKGAYEELRRRIRKGEIQ